MSRVFGLVVTGLVAMTVSATVFVMAGVMARHSATDKPSSLADSWSGFAAQRIEQPMTADNNHRWRAGFTIEANAQQVTLSLDIKLLPIGELNRVTLAQQKQAWLAGIGNAWNDRFALVFDDGSRWPIQVKTRFTLLSPHHEVVVHPAKTRPNSHNWHINMPAPVAAHELGHMLGAYDEYSRGATATGLVDTHSLMGSNTSSGITFPRHLHLVLDTIKSLGNLQHAQILVLAPGIQAQAPLNQNKMNRA